MITHRGDYDQPHQQGPQFNQKFILPYPSLPSSSIMAALASSGRASRRESRRPSDEIGPDSRRRDEKDEETVDDILQMDGGTEVLDGRRQWMGGGSQ